MLRSKKRTVIHVVFLLLLTCLNLIIAAIILTGLQDWGYLPSRRAGPKAQIPVSGQESSAAPAGSFIIPFSTVNPTLPGEFAGPAPSPTPPLPTPAPWQSRERVNILLMGIDHRAETAPRDVPRTDSMILLTIDPVRKTGGMLSIPRDLWVYMPETGSSHKINTAYRWGEMRKLPGGGPGQAMRTVSALVGVPVPYYVLLDFNAFVRLIDEMGGLDMHIREEIKVDPIGPGNTVTLKPGVQTISGAVALAYARNRHTEFDDFDRSERQQEVILAIRKQVLDFDMLPGLAAKAPALYRQIASGIHTNLTLDQSIRLAWLASQVPEKNIRRSAFNFRQDFIYRTVETVSGPQDVLILKPERMHLLRQELFMD